MKRYLLSLLVIVLLFAMSTGAWAKDFSSEADGRNGNSHKNGSFDVLISEGPYYVGETVSIAVDNLVIDGPIDTLVITGAGDVSLQDTPGLQSLVVTATTYFKNGKKAGLIHTQISKTIEIEVIAIAKLPVATSDSAKWNGHPNEHNTVRVDYTITIEGKTYKGHVNFNHDDRVKGYVIVKRQFIVLYLAPPNNTNDVE